MPTNDTPRVFLACLACYNEGRIHGEWIDATNEHSMWDLIYRLQGTNCALCSEPEEEHNADGHAAGCTGFTLPTGSCGHIDNDWHIQDSEGFHGITVGESPSLELLATLASNIEEHGEAFAVYVSHVGADWDDTDGFQEAYCGDYSGHGDPQVRYAEQLADDLGATTGNESWPLNCIDWERAARDLFCGDYWEESGHIFRSL